MSVHTLPTRGSFSINFAENRARGNRKSLKWLKTVTKSNFRTLKLQSHEEYLIYRTLSINCKSIVQHVWRKWNSYEAFAQFEELAVNGTSRTLEKWLIDCQLSSLTTFKFQAGVSSTLKRCTIAHFNRVYKSQKSLIQHCERSELRLHINLFKPKTYQNETKQKKTNYNIEINFGGKKSCNFNSFRTFKAVVKLILSWCSYGNVDFWVGSLGSWDGFQMELCWWWHEGSQSKP